MSFRASNEDAGLPDAWYRIPILQAPIGAAAGPELAAAVSNAGGLGCVALTGSGCIGARRLVRRTRALTNRSFTVNFVLAYDVEAEIEAVLEESPALTSFFWGDPSPYVDRVHAAGSRLMMTVGSVEEAKKAVGAGVDIIVAQGWEAGGHVRGQVSTFALIPAVVDAVAPIPVVAAGGIADGRGRAAAILADAENYILAKGWKALGPKLERRLAAFRERNLGELFINTPREDAAGPARGCRRPSCRSPWLRAGARRGYHAELD